MIKKKVYIYLQKGINKALFGTDIILYTNLLFLF